MSQSITGENNPTNHMEQEEPTSPLQHEDNPEPDDVHVLDAENTAEPTRLSACIKVSPNNQGQEMFQEENPIYLTNPEELTSPLQNEEESDVLYTENTADSTRVSTCGKGSLGFQGHNISEEEATYVIGNEPEHTSQSDMITNEHFYVIPKNNDEPSPSADVYFVSDKNNTDDSAMYTASADNEELDPNDHGHTEEEPKVEQAGSTVTKNSNSNRDANRSQPDTSENDAKDEACRADLFDDGDMQPYAVADIRDHETYLRTAALRARQTEGCSDANKTGRDPDAQEAQNPRRKGFPNPMYGANAGQQASDDTEGFPNPVYRANVPQQASEDTGVHDIQTPSNNANELKANPIYVSNAGQQAPDDTNANRGSIDGTNPTTLGSSNGTNAPNLGSINYSTNPTTLGSTNDTHGANPVSCNTGGTNPPIKEKKERVSSRLATGPYPGTTAGLAVSSDNEIFGTHSSIKTIQVFSMKGVKLRNIPTGDMKPYGIATGLNNSLWVVLQGGHENRLMNENAVSQYSKDGHVLAKYNCNGRFIIHGIAVDKLADKIILTIERRSGVRLHTEFVWFRPTHTQGTPTCNMSKFGSIEGDARHSVAVDKRGNIFIPDRGNGRVLKYDKDGVYISSFGSKDTGAGYLLGPYGICVDSWGRVIVADTYNHRVEMFTAKGDHVCTVAYINYPVRVAISGEGQLVVSHSASVTIFPKHN
uniref:SMP-30/Gluconolactonase/LRE-like region domain-containing protein n=1 Tax=Branchiostoma floridae TaxID=7739 RepID=C3Z0J0_BRAFL|eukprot:XP_002598026.1 hypothetical protein BRAFLDRAFT_79748 [Branchiostoma floridae]